MRTLANNKFTFKAKPISKYFARFCQSVGTFNVDNH